MAITSTDLTKIIFNKMSRKKYEELKAAGQLADNEFYITPDEVDATPTEGSENGVTSGGVYDALALKADKSDTYTKQEVDDKISAKDSLPAQAGNAGKFLSTNGTAASWEALPEASTTEKGIVKLASADEITAGTATDVAVSVKDLADAKAALNTAIDGKADKATTLAGYGIEDAYTKDEIDGKISSTFHYKGSKETYAELPAEGNVVGDVWNIVQADAEHGVKAGDNVAWTGDAWDVLAGTVDLSAYYTSEQVDNLVNPVKEQVTKNTAQIETNTKSIEQNAADITELQTDAQTKANMSQTLDDSETMYPSNKAVKDALDAHVSGVIKDWGE